MNQEGLVPALRQHAVSAAARTLERLQGPLTAENLPQFLEDRECLRLPTELQFHGGDLEDHQFAQPAFHQEEGRRYCVLHICPRYSDRPETHPFIIAYMAAAINYSKAATSELCETYGATLMGMEPDAFYEKICEIADT